MEGVVDSRIERLLNRYNLAIAECDRYQINENLWWIAYHAKLYESEMLEALSGADELPSAIAAAIIQWLKANGYKVRDN